MSQVSLMLECAHSPLLVEGGVVEGRGGNPGPVVRAVGPQPPGDAGQVRADGRHSLRAAQNHTQLACPLVWTQKGKKKKENEKKKNVMFPKNFLHSKKE